MIYRELQWFNVNVVTHNIRSQYVALDVVDQPARRVQYCVLSVLKVSALRQLVATLRLEHLPVIEPCQQYPYAEEDQQENEHLPAACSLHFCVPLLASFRFNLFQSQMTNPVSSALRFNLFQSHML